MRRHIVCFVSGQTENRLMNYAWFALACEQEWAGVSPCPRWVQFSLYWQQVFHSRLDKYKQMGWVGVFSMRSMESRWKTRTNPFEHVNSQMGNETRDSGWKKSLWKSLSRILPGTLIQLTVWIAKTVPYFFSAISNIFTIFFSLYFVFRLSSSLSSFNGSIFTKNLDFSMTCVCMRLCPMWIVNALILHLPTITFMHALQTP